MTYSVKQKCKQTNKKNYTKVSKWCQGLIYTKSRGKCLILENVIAHILNHVMISSHVRYQDLVQSQDVGVCVCVCMYVQMSLKLKAVLEIVRKVSTGR